MKVLLLGGTGEARQLAALLTGAGVDVLTSLAGRTANARLPAGEVRSGGFGGADGLAAWLRAHPVDAVVDATHPYAATMTAHAITAARATDVPLLVLRRPGWTPEPGDDWHPADSHADAAAMLPALGKRVFLTIGRQGLDAYAATGLWTLARCVDPPEPSPSWCELLLARGPFAEADELELLQEHRIDVLVTKNSGGAATAAKLRAARQLHLPVVMIRRPELPDHVEAVTSPAEAVTWLDQEPLNCPPAAAP
jgi:precorrin-6A/cobalt-precorrin-6A reductase